MQQPIESEEVSEEEWLALVAAEALAAGPVSVIPPAPPLVAPIQTATINFSGSHDSLPAPFSASRTAAHSRGVLARETRRGGYPHFWSELMLHLLTYRRNEGERWRGGRPKAATCDTTTRAPTR
jgi:hypothetical protein